MAFSVQIAFFLAGFVTSMYLYGVPVSVVYWMIAGLGMNGKPGGDN